mgnify:CR=1 FL=1
MCIRDRDSVYLKNIKEIEGKYSRAIFLFDLKTNSELLIKTGFSSVSFENAKLNLENDIKDWNFDKVKNSAIEQWNKAVSYTHLRAHETVLDLVCRLLLEKKTQQT